MHVLINLPGPLREFAGKQSSVRVEVQSNAAVVEALHVMFAAYPGLRDRVLAETGETRRHVNIYVGNEDVRYTGGLRTPISEDSEISIVPAISGG